MRLDGSGCHLTYCSNIHPGESWSEVRDNLARHLPAVRDQVAPGRAFGIGLRLSARAAEELAQPDTLAEFQSFLAQGNFYVFTINGFPYGAFHATPVKEQVYLPDWRDTQRLDYSNLLADLLARLLPQQEGMTGSVSTVPGAFKVNASDAASVQRIVEHLLQHTAHLVRLKRETGSHISLALEPEPCCLLETVEETVRFFTGHLFSQTAVARLAQLCSMEAALAQQALHEHLGICLDLCHAAVEFEDPQDCLKQLADAGIGIFKMQVTSGLRIERFSAAMGAELRRYDDPVYLHQVVQCGPHGLLRHTDLSAALQAATDGSADGQEWRVHFHVPVFLEALGIFQSTQPFVRALLQTHRRRAISSHLEVETYTWDVLPAHLRDVDVDAAIARELQWVLGELAG